MQYLFSDGNDKEDKATPPPEVKYVDAILLLCVKYFYCL